MSTDPTPFKQSHLSPRRDRLEARRESMRSGMRVLIGMVAVMWVAQIVNSLDHYDLSKDHGLDPRSLSGLQGIAFAPFLHWSWGHLIGNTIPFVVLGLMLALEGVALLSEVTVVVILVAGLGTWLTAGSHSDTVGASGVVFGYAAFLIGRGFFSRNALQLGVGAIVAIAFGLSLLSDLVPHSGVSWEDHAFGAIGGLLAARLVTAQKARSGARSRKPAATQPADA